MNGRFRVLASTLAVVAVSMGAVLAVHASGGRGEGSEREGGEGSVGEVEGISGLPQGNAEARAQLAVYRQECGDCHVAYPPQLLDARLWQSLLVKLDDHFGDTATLTADSLSTVTRYLTSHAARPGSAMLRSGGDTPRITRTAWFIDEHDEVPKAAWRRDSVGSAANCAACHRGAEEGRYDEENTRIPR